MPKQPQREDDIEENQASSEREDSDESNRFSQDDDDLAGRSWHGMNSDTEVEQSGRFDTDDDTEEEDARKRTLS